ncbi:MAG: biosynthetic-type acetolactate synthase large subunit [Candidatus Omnitrophica bacterium]|nr:biosynthetic-type acetolactate synthase large subunit [Candidatus Omnitrophota bacterium]
MKGSEIIIESLKREKVEVIFGYPGGALLPFFDCLYDAPIKFYLTRHEQAAAHAADGYARASGKTGVCVATSGPGATNLVTGITNAYMDSIPIVALTGQVRTSLIGNDAFQEADTTGITRSITKHNYLVKNTEDLARVFKEAFYIASSGRPGPVLVDLPVDVQMGEAEFSYPENISIRSYRPTYYGHPGQIKKALRAIEKSKHPVIMAGGGVITSGASGRLFEFAKKIQAPVTTTLMGLGAYPAEDELFLGMPGMHGTVYANRAITNSDLLIAIGCRFDDRVTGKLDAFAPQAKIIHIDIDPTSISKNVKADIPIVGDVGNILGEMLELIKKPAQSKEWLKEIERNKKKYPLSYRKSSLRIKPQAVVEEIFSQTRGEAIISTEVGQNQMWAAQFYKFKFPRTFITSGGLGTMGFGFPAAIGASIACPERLVFDIAGDGSIQMNIQELATVATYKIPVKIIILNNNYLGMVRQWQELFYKKRYAATPLDNPDFVKVAEGFGVKAMRIEKEKDIKKAIKEIIAYKGPVLADFWIEEEENVFPMVPAGASIDRMIGELA